VTTQPEPELVHVAADRTDDDARGDKRSGRCGSVISLTFKVGLYYGDFISDLLLALSLFAVGEDGLATAVIAVLAANPLALSAMDLYEYYSVSAENYYMEGEDGDIDGERREDKMGWFGVMLNLTNTRMLYTWIQPLLYDDEQEAAAAASAGANIKLFEAVFESMPQLFI
jgi:hypothetical protein